MDVPAFFHTSPATLQASASNDSSAEMPSQGQQDLTPNTVNAYLSHSAPAIAAAGQPPPPQQQPTMQAVNYVFPQSNGNAPQCYPQINTRQPKQPFPSFSATGTPSFMAANTTGTPPGMTPVPGGNGFYINSARPSGQPCPGGVVLPTGAHIAFQAPSPPGPLPLPQLGPQLTPVTNPRNTIGQAVLFVGQLNYEVTELDVHRLFSFYGNVLNVVLLKDQTRSRRGAPGAVGRDPNKPEKDDVSEEKRVVGSSAFVTYGSTDEADLAIISLHNKYCMDNRDKPLQVSYCQKTNVISEFGFQHAKSLHELNPANPIPAARPRPLLL